MPSEDFLHLAPSERRDIIEAGAAASPWTTDVLEKDAWLVWCLDALFRQPDAPQYAFKGGTSLSKVYAAIDRFSEDVDITVDTEHADILGDEDPLDDTHSSTKRRRLNEQAAANLATYLRDRLGPYLEGVAASLPEDCRPTVTPEGAVVRVSYPSVLPDGDARNYLRRHVLLEFGTRGSIDPREKRTIATYIEEAVDTTDELRFPTAHVIVMRVERTFWEKATLIHAEVTRRTPKPRERYARHWYDLYRLSMHGVIGPAALRATATFAQVIDIKAKQFRGGGVSYEDCGRGHLRLIPEGELLTHLQRDYRQMSQAGMFLAEPPTFEQILEHLSELEQAINAARGAAPIA